MTKLTIFLTGLLFIGLQSGHTLNAPVTEAHSVINPLTGTDISVPVTVSGFMDIGSFSLVLDYNPAVLTYLSDHPNAALGNFLLSNNPVLGRITISYYALFGVTMADGTILADITFHYNGGSTALTWYPDNGSCEYAKFDGGSYTPLNDLPHSHYYRNGQVIDNPAPVTIAPVLTGVPQGPLSIPILVTGFNDIGTISLMLEYSSDALVYQDSFTGNPVLTAAGTWAVGTQNGPGLVKYLVISWIKTEPGAPSPPVNLPDSSTLITFLFNYTDPLKFSELEWFDNGAGCEYSDGNYTVLPDIPAGTFYKNGLVTGTGQGPVTIAPVTTAVAGTAVTIPVEVRNFTNISSFQLTLDYDPAVLTFLNATNGTLPVSWTVAGNASVPGRLILTGSGTAATLADSSVIMQATFTFNGGGTLLTWFDADTVSCFYTDATTFLTLNDHPRSLHYINGSITPAPVLSAKVFMQGPYDEIAANMSKALNTQGILPLTQPYSGSPWNYAGTENVTSIPGPVTDWILVELREDSSSGSVVAKRAGFLTGDGIVTGLDGISPLALPGIIPGYYHIVIRHRNHLAVMSNTVNAVNPVSVLFDFTTDPGKYFGGTNGCILVDQSLNRWGMTGADANCDGSVYINDFTDYWVPGFGVVQGYHPADFNMDGNVYINDNTDFWVSNFGLNNVLP